MSAAPLVTIFSDKHGARINAARPMDLEEIERVIRSAPPAREKELLPLLKLAKFGTTLTDKRSLRHDANVLSVYGLEGDYDGETMPMQHAVERFTALGLAALLYTSARHRPETPRWRVVVPLSKPLEGTPEQLRERRKHLTGVLNAILGGVLKSESFALSQCYFFGRIQGRPDPEIVRLSGICFDELKNPPPPVFPHSGGVHKPQSKTQDGAIGEDRSRDLLSRVARELRRGMAEYEIIALHRAHPHAASQADPVRAVQRCIAKARIDPETATKKSPDTDAPAARTLKGIDFADMKAHVRDSFLVEDVLVPRTLAGFIGATGMAKTFLATHLATCLANNSPFFGRKVRGGLVVYAALEGPASAENRFVACRQRQNLGGIPLRLTPGPVNLRDIADVHALIVFVHDAEADHGTQCVAVFVDTLSRAMAGGDENSSDDMGALIAGADMVRLQTNATVCLVHHVGKDASRGARGHSSLKAALDTEVEITVEGDTRIAHVTKQRDLPSGARLPFRLEVVELGRDEEGHVVSTCIVEPSEDVPNSRRAPSGKNQSALLAALQE